MDVVSSYATSIDACYFACEPLCKQAGEDGVCACVCVVSGEPVPMHLYICHARVCRTSPAAARGCDVFQLTFLGQGSFSYNYFDHRIN